MAQEFRFESTEMPRLREALNKLTDQIKSQGERVSERLDHASNRVQKTVDEATDRLSKAVDKASAASERHARSLVRATWALVGATVALLLVSGIHAYLSFGRTPQEQAMRDLVRCQTLAVRFLGATNSPITEEGLRGLTFRCLGF